MKAIILSKLVSHFSKSGFVKRIEINNTHTSEKKNASSAIRRQITFPAEHQSNPSLFPRLAFISLFVTKMINSHLVYYCTASCHGSCNYTILSFSAVSDPCREEDTAGSHGRGADAEVNTVAERMCHLQHLCFYDCPFLLLYPHSLKRVNNS